MNLADVMDELAGKLTAIPSLAGRVYAWPVAKIVPPAAIVAYPEQISWDGTYARGVDKMTIPVMAVVGRPSDRSTRDALSAYVAGSGPESVKAAVEAGQYLSCDWAVVQPRTEFDVASIAGVDYLTAVFTVEIAGSGT